MVRKDIRLFHADVIQLFVRPRLHDRASCVAQISTLLNLNPIFASAGGTASITPQAGFILNPGTSGTAPSWVHIESTSKVIFDGSRNVLELVQQDPTNNGITLTQSNPASAMSIRALGVIMIGSGVIAANMRPMNGAAA